MICASTKNVSRESNSLCTKSRGRGALGHDTYFNSIQFAVYSGVNHDYKKCYCYGVI